VAGLLVAWLLVARRTVLVLVGWGGPPGVAEEQEAVLSRSAAGDERQADGQCATVPHECRSRSCAARWLRLPRCRPAAAWCCDRRLPPLRMREFDGNCVANLWRARKLPTCRPAMRGQILAPMVRASVVQFTKQPFSLGKRFFPA